MASMPIKGFVFGGIAVAMIVALRPAAAQDPTEETFVRYHAAIHAAQVCEGRQLEQQGLSDPNADKIKANQERMGAVINGKVNGEISAGRRLELIEESKRIVEDLAQKKGCNSPELQDVLTLFRTDLEPVLE